MEALSVAIERSIERRARRAASLPAITFPPELPVVERREEIARAIAEHQVVIVCGETGSGKTTQIPKICLELGRGVTGVIGHTQPRRIAARSVAARIATELSTSLGKTVGFKVRFNDRTSPESLVKVMTDGVLLAETQSDRWLEQYDTLIIDEAHERSLNIDFLLGYLRRILPRRPDLKVIVTSATIDPARFAEHFAYAGPDGAAIPAPIIEVSGRTFPVEIRHRPLEGEPASAHREAPDEHDEDEPDMQASILRAVDELCEVDVGDGPRDILIFLSGEREIRETAENLRKHHAPATPRGAAGHIEILPLYARLSNEEQNRVFAPPSRNHARRIVLATNVAETSLTVPGIRFVIDPGFARISRYSPRNKVQRLPIEPISQASADQRAGRCGRVADGVAIRLYSREAYEESLRFTDPEIQRTNLASVILQMTALRLGRIEEFPFLDPPDERSIRDGFDTLEELGAVTSKGELTPLGTELARLPIDPRIGRMILAARDEKCVDAVLVIAAALSVQDPRERPFDARDDADRAHEAFRHAVEAPASTDSANQDSEPGSEDSDFLIYLNLWNAYQECAKRLSSNKLRNWCKERFLSPVRMREWRDIHHQLRDVAGSMGMIQHRKPRRQKPRSIDEHSTESDGHAAIEIPSYAPLHRALLTGLLSNVSTLTDRFEYSGPRGIKCSIFPGSALFKRQPRWIMAAEVVRTTRVYARTVARITPGWIEKVAPHLVKRTYSAPYWNERMAQVWATERVTFMGLELIAHRKAHYGLIDPKGARDIFIQRALVEGDYWSKAGFAQHNRQLIRDVHELQARFRRHDLAADGERMFAFFDQRIPESVYSGRAFEQWHKSAVQDDPRVLYMSPGDLLATDAGAPAVEEFPDQMEFGGLTLPLEYRFAPGESDDGVTLVVPVGALGAVRDDRCQWLVPGLLPEKIIALLRTLPKDVRRLLVPAPEFAQRALADDAMRRHGVGRLTDALATALSRLIGQVIDPAQFQNPDLPDHLRLNFRVEEGEGESAKEILARGRDLTAIRTALRARLAEGISIDTQSAAAQWHRDGVMNWDFGDLPEEVDAPREGLVVRGYPAIVEPATLLVRNGSGSVKPGVMLRILESRFRADLATKLGLRRLFFMHTRDEIKFLIHNAPGYDRLALQFGVIGAAKDLDEGLGLLIAHYAFLTQPGPVRTRAQFDNRLDAGWHTLGGVASECVALVAQIMEAHHAISLRLGDTPPEAFERAFADVRVHVASLITPGFLATTPTHWLTHVPRFLRCDVLRLEKLASRGIAKDTEVADQIRSVRAQWEDRVTRRRGEGVFEPELEEFRWLIEEWRVSLFAQELGTSEPMSFQRLEKRWAAIKA